MCKGLKGYAEKYAEKQVLTTLIELVQNGLLTVKDAATQAGMTPEEFQQKMQHRKRCEVKEAKEQIARGEFVTSEELHQYLGV